MEKLISSGVFIIQSVSLCDPYQRTILKSTHNHQYQIQSQQKRKLSGQQDFCRKNFPDKARKLRQFSNPRQMRIKGGFARFWIIQLHFLDDLDTF